MLTYKLTLLASIVSVVCPLDFSRYVPSHDVIGEEYSSPISVKSEINITGSFDHLRVLGRHEYTTEDPSMADPEKAKRELRTWILKLDCRRFPIEFVHCVGIKRVLFKKVFSNPEFNNLIRMPIGHAFVAKLQESNIEVELPKFLQENNITFTGVQ